MTSRVTALRGVSPSFEPSTTTSDGSRRLDRNIEMANKEVTEWSQEQQDQGSCQEGQETNEVRTRRSGGPEGANCNISQFEEGRPHNSSFADPESHQQSPEAPVNSLNAASQTDAIEIAVQTVKSP